MWKRTQIAKNGKVSRFRNWQVCNLPFRDEVSMFQSTRSVEYPLISWDDGLTSIVRVLGESNEMHLLILFYSRKVTLKGLARNLHRKDVYFLHTNLLQF
jgi:hypothetical protein